MTHQFMWYNGEFVPSADAKTSLLTHGLHYGTGVFEGIRCYETPKGPAVFRLTEHLLRMKDGCDVLGLPFDIAQVEEAILELVARNECSNAYIRPLTYFETGGLGLDVDTLKACSLIATLPWSSHLGEKAKTYGISVSKSKLRRNSRKALPPLKLCGGYINSIIAKRKASSEGFEEALFVDDHGYVVEATGENVFYVKDSRVYAVEHPDALAGITRSTVMSLSGAVSKRTRYEELLDADEVFLTGTSAEITGVNTLDERRFSLGPITRELQDLYQAIVHGHNSEYSGWLSWN